MTIHFVYAKGLRTSAPHCITQELAARLPRCLAGAATPSPEVKIYDLAEARSIHPAPGGEDILIGHPHQDSRTPIAASIGLSGWKRRIIMCPFSHAHVELNGWMETLVEQADVFLAITGRYWFDTMEDSLYSHWKCKTRRLDLAVNPKWFPAVKRMFNPPGKRRFLYIGYTGRAKGTDYFCTLAEVNTNLHFGWIGGVGSGGIMTSQRVESHGACDMNLPESLRLAASYDFVISCGRSDANPTTLLEGLAWGLVPVCTLQSGYRAGQEPLGENWLVNIPLDDSAGASAILQRLNQAPESELANLVARGRSQLEQYYTWDRFARDVAAAIREPVPARPGDSEWLARAAANRARLHAAINGSGGVQK